MRHSFLVLVLLLLLSWLVGCAARDGRRIAQELADNRGFTPVVFQANGFTLRGFLRCPDWRRRDSLVVYIEGDGHAYEDRRTPSSDPTPHNPMGLRLALQDPAACLLYLGRPCQYLRDEPCSMRYWTVDRYAPVVVDAMNQALEQAKEQTGAKQLYLAGYSGGGSMAVLLAARRQDVAGIATIAGNLDHALWTSLHEVSPLRGSLNPADEAKRLRNMPQVHFAGENDCIVPPQIAESYMQQLGSSKNARLVLVEDTDHDCCWPGIWAELLHKWHGYWGR